MCVFWVHIGLVLTPDSELRATMYLGKHIECWGCNLGWPYARQTPYPLLPVGKYLCLFHKLCLRWESSPLMIYHLRMDPPKNRPWWAFFKRARVGESSHMLLKDGKQRHNAVWTHAWIFNNPKTTRQNHAKPTHRKCMPGNLPAVSLSNSPGSHHCLPRTT